MNFETAIQLEGYDGKSSYAGKTYEHGVFIGKGATWNNLDGGARDRNGLAFADIMLPGFFPRAELDRFVKTGHAMRGHGKQGDSRAYGNEKAVGIPLDAMDNGKGLEVVFAWHATDDAQNERVKIEERLALGKSAPLSIWYVDKKTEKFQGKSAIDGAIKKYVAPEYQADAFARASQFHYVRVLKEGKLLGVDTVYEGMDQFAGVTASKSATMDTEISVIVLAPRDTPWNAKAAIERVRVATDSSDELTAAFGKCFLQCDGAPEAPESYKFPITDVIDGELRIVPRAVFVAAGKVSSDAGRAAVSALYARMRTDFGDGGIIPPWEKRTVAAPMFSAKHTFEQYEAKGAFEEEMNEKVTSPYFLFDIWCAARCDARNMAWINEQAGVAFDLCATLKEINAEFHARLDAAVDYEFQEAVVDAAVTDAGSSGAKSAANVDSVANWANGLGYLSERLESRAARLIGLRGKEARTLSDASLNPIDAAADAMIEHGNKLKSMTVAERDKRKAKVDAKAKGKEADQIVPSETITDAGAVDRLARLAAIEKQYAFLNI